MDPKLTKILVWNKIVVMYFTKPSRLTADPEKQGEDKTWRLVVT